MIKTALLFLSFCFALSAVSAQAEQGSIETRLELADKMLAINPPRDQVRAAIDQYIKIYMSANPLSEQEQFRTAMLGVLNYKALEGVSREAYADLFTEAELAAMIEYYSKPEAISARAKLGQLDAKIYPEIIRMIDQAIMRTRTTRH